MQGDQSFDKVHVSDAKTADEFSDDDDSVADDGSEKFVADKNDVNKIRKRGSSEQPDANSPENDRLLLSHYSCNASDDATEQTPSNGDVTGLRRAGRDAIAVRIND